jgi:PEP-CTERM motif-containing protein
MLKTILALTAGAFVALASPAQATVTLWDGTGANDTIAWAQLGPAGTAVSTPVAVVSNNGLTGSVNDSDGSAQRRDEGTDWNSNFAPGDALLFNNFDGLINITFDTPVTAAGAQFGANLFGPFLARIWYDDGTFANLGFNVPGVNAATEDDSAVFIGVISDSPNIVGITYGLHVTQNTFGFVIGDVQLIDSVPEPGTWAMMLLGFGAIGLSMRRRRRTFALAQAA